MIALAPHRGVSLAHCTDSSRDQCEAADRHACLGNPEHSLRSGHAIAKELKRRRMLETTKLDTPTAGVSFGGYTERTVCYNSQSSGDLLARPAS